MAPMRMIAALLAVFSLNCAAAPFIVRLGIERIVLDAPPGFADTTELASPRLQSLSSVLTPASNRILLFALTDADLRNFETGDRIEAERYMLAVTPKNLESTRVTREQFAGLVSTSLRNLGAQVDPQPDLIAFLEKQPIGKANLLAELKKEQDAFSVLQATRLPPVPGAKFYNSSSPQYLVFTTTLVLVRGRALQLVAYSLYRDPSDIEWLKEISQRWQEEIQRLNR
jgi:hypothetical protein